MLYLYVNYVGLKSRVVSKVKGLFGDESGVTAIEYGLIAGLIAVVIIGVVTTIGTDLSTKFQTISTKLEGAGG